MPEPPVILTVPLVPFEPVVPAVGFVIGVVPAVPPRSGFTAAVPDAPEGPVTPGEPVVPLTPVNAPLPLCARPRPFILVADLPQAKSDNSAPASAARYDFIGRPLPQLRPSDGGTYHGSSSAAFQKAPRGLSEQRKM